MSDALPTICSVQYLDPWAELPPGTPYSGVFVTVDPPESSANIFLAGRLLREGKPEAYGTGQSAGSVQILPHSPLSSGTQYRVQVQWLKTGTIPKEGDWSETNENIASSPVLTQSFEIIAGQVSDTQVTFSWRKPDNASQLSGVYAQIFDKSHIVKGLNYHFGTSTSISLTLKSIEAPYYLYFQGLQSVKPNPGSGGESFQAPYSIGPCSRGFPLPIEALSITSVTYDGFNVSATWEKLGEPSNDVDISYELLIVCNNVITAFPATAKGGVALLLQNSIHANSCQISARMNYGVIKGPQANPVTVETGIVSNVTQTTDPSTGIATLHWDDFNTAPAGCTVAYKLAFSTGSPAPVKGISYTLPSALTADEFNEVSIARVVTQTALGQIRTGPFSASYRLGTTQPTLLSATYDGSTIAITWEAMVEEVREYTLNLFSGSNTVATVSFRAQPGVTNFSFKPSENPHSITIVSTNTLTVTLQATLEGEAGPGLPTPVNILFIPCYFLSPTTTDTAYIYSATSLATISNPSTALTDITLYLPDIYTGTWGGKITHGPFTLNQNSEDNSANFPYTLTIGATARLFSTESIRTNIQTAYKNFLEKVETSSDGGPGVTPWGISVLQEAIARHMPQTFEETLYYNYGLNLISGAGTADLRPGMILRVIPSDFIVLPNSDTNPGIQYLDGYVNGSPLDYDISGYTSSSTDWAVGFDAFLSTLFSANVLTINPHIDNQGNEYMPGISEAADLYRNAPKSFYRLFIPGKLINPYPQIQNTSQPQSQFNLVSADSFTSLEGKTNPLTSNTNFYFTGRSILKLCIRVTINGNEHIVPIGTTVRNILERSGRVPPISTSSPSDLILEGITLNRAIGQTDTLGYKSIDVGRSYPVQLCSNVYKNNQTALDLPLLHGDILTFEL